MVLLLSSGVRLTVAAGRMMLRSSAVAAVLAVLAALVPGQGGGDGDDGGG